MRRSKMRSSIVTVGTEILFGQIVNTNSAWLSRELNDLGIDVMYHFAVGDNDQRLADILGDALDNTDLVITTGGLGPTEDDLTKETVSHVMHDELAVHAESLAALEKIARVSGRKMTPNNYKQAMMPTRAVVFDNDAGSAPGFALSENGKTIVSLPGPPRELTRMWKRCARPYLSAFSDKTIYYRLVRFFGIGESNLETMLLPLIDTQTDPTIATYAKEGECSVRIASKRSDASEAKRAVDDILFKISEIAGEYILSYDGRGINEEVGEYLIENDITISACESCTGGMFSNMCVSVPGISHVFDSGFVTYTEKSKIKELGVSPETLDEFSAESPEVAREMAAGLAARTGTRIAVSSTGVAGPGSRNGREAGTMFVGLAFDGNVTVREIATHRDDREWNRNYCCLVMFDEIRRVLAIRPKI